jgi:hypothetical protein
MTTIHSAVHDLSRGLGALVCWELSDTAITPDDLRALLASLGENPAVVPNIDPASAAARASREWGLGRGSEERFRAEVVQRESAHVEIGILKRHRVAADEVGWVQVAAVGLWLNQDGTLRAITENAGNGTSQGPFEAQVASFRSLLAKRLDYLDADWIRPNLIQKRLDAVGAFSLRRQGGVLFVDRTHFEEVERLARIVRSIGSSSFDIVHVAETDESRASVSRAANAYLEDQVNDLVAKLDDWTEKARAPRSDAVENLIEQVGDLVLRGGLYADVLQVTMDGVRERLDAVKARALKILTEGVEEVADAAS